MLIRGLTVVVRMLLLVLEEAVDGFFTSSEDTGLAGGLAAARLSIATGLMIFT